MIALFVWELGSGRGHLEHMKPVLAALLHRGWSVVCAVRDLKAGRNILTEAGGAKSKNRLNVVQAPIFTHRSPTVSRPPTSIAEILAHIGFGDQSLLRPLFEDWSRIIDLVRPNIVIGDFAPTVTAAAQGRVPVIMTGNGWTIPPDGSPIPALPLRSYDRVAAEQAENRICDAVSAASGGNWLSGTLAQLLRGDARFIYTSAALDPYRHQRQDELSCPPNLVIPPSHNESSAAHILLYLPQNHPSIDRVLEAVGTIGMRTFAFLGGLQRPSPPNVTIQPLPLDLPAMLPAARLVIHHGGLGIANWSLAYRKPQAIVAIDLEKILIAHAITSSGSGLSVHPNATGADMIGSFRRAVHLNPLRISSGFANETPEQSIEAIVRSCYEARVRGFRF